MTKEEKSQVIDELKEKFQAHDFFYITDAAGMTVAQVNAFRKACHEKGLEYKVVKNTLIKKALQVIDCDYTPFDAAVLKGFSGVIFSKESGKLPAQLLKEFHKAQDTTKPALKGASIEKALFIGADSLDQLVKLKSRYEMIGEVIGLLQSPAKNVVSALQSAPNKLAGIVKTLQERENN